MRKNLLVFHQALAPYRIDFFNSLNKSFNANFYFNSRNVLNQKFDQDELKSKCDFKCNYLNNGLNIFGKSFKTRVISIIKKYNPDIIICSEYSPTTVLAFIYSKLFRKKMKLYTICDDSLENARSRKGFRAFIRNFISKNINGVIVSSNEVSIWFKNNISNKIKLLELPIVHNESIIRKLYHNSLNESINNIKDYKLEGKILILFIGRLVEIKNIDFLIKGFSKIDQRNLCLVIVGDGPLYKDLEFLVQKLKIKNEVIFLGRKEGKFLYSWYNIAQVFVLPSIFERFGAVVNEALVGGCFVLCSRLAGASSLVNKNNGLLFDPRDKNDFVDKLQFSITKSKEINLKEIILRDSNMPFTFYEKIQKLIKQLNS